jgi:hypothetical protein
MRVVKFHFNADLLVDYSIAQNVEIIEKIRKLLGDLKLFLFITFGAGLIYVHLHFQFVI